MGGGGEVGGGEEAEKLGGEEEVGGRGGDSSSASVVCSVSEERGTREGRSSREGGGVEGKSKSGCAPPSVWFGSWGSGTTSEEKDCSLVSKLSSILGSSSGLSKPGLSSNSALACGSLGTLSGTSIGSTSASACGSLGTLSGTSIGSISPLGSNSVSTVVKRSTSTTGWDAVGVWSCSASGSLEIGTSLTGSKTVVTVSVSVGAASRSTRGFSSCEIDIKVECELVTYTEPHSVFTVKNEMVGKPMNQPMVHEHSYLQL